MSKYKVVKVKYPVNNKFYYSIGEANQDGDFYPVDGLEGITPRSDSVSGLFSQLEAMVECFNENCKGVELKTDKQRELSKLEYRLEELLNDVYSYGVKYRVRIDSNKFKSLEKSGFNLINQIRSSFSRKKQ